jgi:dTDP-4-dehydrorhamnose reductase
MNMRIAVVGSTGMFGSELLNLLKTKGIESQGFNRGNLDLEQSPDSLATEFKGFDAVVNAIAFTAVDKAESEIYEANTVNGIYAGLLAQAAKIAGARFIHISTDYIFDGTASTPYKVDEQINPQTAYGKSKALGEQLVAESGADYSILRTAWLYGANGRCFPRVMAELLKKNGSVRVVSDQVGQPTWTRDLAEVVVQVVHLEKMPRIVHAVSSGKATWADFAKEVAFSMGLSADEIEEISSEEFPTAAKRPAWSVLDNSSDGLTPIGDWRERWREAAPEVLRGI